MSEEILRGRSPSYQLIGNTVFCLMFIVYNKCKIQFGVTRAIGKASRRTLPYPTGAHTAPSCAMGSGLEWGRLRGGAVRRALLGLATDLRAALGD